MKRISKLLCGLLMSLLCFNVTGLYDKISVIQSPGNITVNEGQSAYMTCCWTTETHPLSNLKVRWFKNEKRVPLKNQMYQRSPSQNCSTLHITQITLNDTGEYLCELTQDIPILLEFNACRSFLSLGSEQQRTTATTTKVAGSTANAKNKTTAIESSHTTSHSTLYLSLAAIAGLLTICLVITVCKIKRSCPKSDRVVIHQIPHNEGEEHENHEEEELSSGSSRGSLQWYQVPVYWSYFDVQSAQDQ